MKLRAAAELAVAAGGAEMPALEPESAWLRLDQGGALGVARALHGGLRLPTFELRQGLDTYADPKRLAEVLEALPHHDRY